jgi:hypothetical protein
MIDRHHPPVPGGPGLPPPPQRPAQARSGKAAAAPQAVETEEAMAAAVEAVFTGPDGQLVQQRWDQAAGMVRWEDLEPVAPFPVVPGRSFGPG